MGFVTLGDIAGTRFLRLAALAESEGLSSVWMADEPFFRGAFPLAAACAGATSSIRLGIGVVSPFDHPPAWMAKDFATVQELAGGRVALGVGASWPPPIEAQGITWSRPLAAVRDTVAIVRSLLRGDTCSHRGRRFSVQDVELSFDAEPEARILIGAMFPRSLAQAGTIAEGVVLSILCPVPYVARAREFCAEGAREAGRSGEGFELVQYFPMEVSDDGAAARASVKRRLAFFIEHSYGSDPAHWAKVAELGEFDIDEFAHVERRLAGGEAPERAVPDDFLDRFAIAGTPSQCLERLAAYKYAGTTEAVALFPPWADLEQQVVTVGRRLAPEWPAL